MNIKSLLLGSAAALVAVSGAQAADAIVVEPEPVEYVRVCDAYGSGFFYIPGTETCLRFNGYLRTMYSHWDYDNEAGAVDAQNQQRWRTRFRFNIDTRNETDWGTLRGWARIQANRTPNGSASVDLDKFLISLAGFRVGQLDHFYVTNHGYAGIFAWGANTGVADEGLYSGVFTTHFLDYTWAQDGLAVTVGISTDTGYNGTADQVSDLDFYAGVNYSADWGGAAFTYVRETNTATNQNAAGFDGDDVDIWKASLTLDLGEYIPGGLIHAWYTSDDDGTSSYVNGNLENLWAVAAQANLTDNFQMFAVYNAGESNHATDNEYKMWSVGAQWFPVDRFRVYGSYVNSDADANTGITNGTGWSFGVRRDF